MASSDTASVVQRRRRCLACDGNDKLARCSLDKHAAYEAAVQGVQAPLAVLAECFTRRFRRPLRALREDFCGTAALLHSFVTDAGADHDGDASGRQGVGVDLDPSALQWAREHGREGSMMRLVCANVLDLPSSHGDMRTSSLDTVQTAASSDSGLGRGGGSLCRDFDAVVALNHSFNVLHTSAELTRYLGGVYSSLGQDGGMVMLDLYGGRTAHALGESGRRVEGCAGVTRYTRSVRSWNPVTRVCRWSIEFETEDGTTHTAFEYVWRVWTPSEITRALTEAGFVEVQHLYASCDSDNERFAPASPTVVDSSCNAEAPSDVGYTCFSSVDVAGRLDRFRWKVRVGSHPAVDFEVCAVQGGGSRVVLSSCDPTTDMEVEMGADAGRLPPGSTTRTVAIQVYVSTDTDADDAPVHLVWQGTLCVDNGPTGGTPLGRGDELRCAAWAGSVIASDAECASSAGDVHCAHGGGGGGGGDGGGDSHRGGHDHAASKTSVTISDVCVALTVDVIQAALALVGHDGDGDDSLDKLSNWYSYVLAVRLPASEHLPASWTRLLHDRGRVTP